MTILQSASKKIFFWQYSEKILAVGSNEQNAKVEWLNVDQNEWEILPDYPFVTDFFMKIKFSFSWNFFLESSKRVTTHQKCRLYTVMTTFTCLEVIIPLKQSLLSSIFRTELIKQRKATDFLLFVASRCFAELWLRPSNGNKSELWIELDLAMRLFLESRILSFLAVADGVMAMKAGFLQISSSECYSVSAQIKLSNAVKWKTIWWIALSLSQNSNSQHSSTIQRPC